jgi:iron complex transport system substrate-binding protein
LPSRKIEFLRFSDRNWQNSRVNELRIVSFLPSATELACALGLEEFIVGISHECNFPPSIRAKSVVVHSALPIKTMTLGEIDRAVGERLRSGESLYEVDTALLRELRPTHILTQDLCQVCAPAGNEVTRALNALPTPPHVVWMSPHSIADIHNDLRNLAALTGRESLATQLIANNEARLDALRAALHHAPIRTVFCAEWIDPLYCCGHWVPEQIEIAGAHDPLGRKWKDSVRIHFEDLQTADPEAIIVMPCGFDLNGSLEQALQLARNHSELKAVRNGQLFAVDASYFSRPSLRVIAGAELLAHILHPNRVEWHGDAKAFKQIGKTSKRCPACGATFECGATTPNFTCWCAELPPLAKTRVTDEGCLCRKCLEQKLAVA